MDTHAGIATEAQPPLPPNPSPTLSSDNQGAKPRKAKAEEATQTVYDRWSNLIPSLVDPLLNYQRSTYRKDIPDIPDTLCCCSKPNECLFSFTTCATLPHILVNFGLFPTAPQQPRTAVSVDLLEFIRALFERSSEATQALAHALNTYYSRRGFYLYNNNDENTIEPFHRGLGYAIQWFNILLVEVERRKDDALLRALEIVKAQQNDLLPTPELGIEQSNAPPPDGDPFVSQAQPKLASHPDQDLSSGECERFLQELCPLCFGGNMFGRSVEDLCSGADIHVSIDGNFNHRHARAAGDCPEFHSPRHLLSKEEVDLRGAQIEKARSATASKSKKKKRGTQALDEAIDACEEAHESGSGSKIKTNLDKFDHGGVMGMTCRHDRPLFLANIDTPGEQQKYGVALIEHLFQHLPRHATVMVAYDVGCVCDRSRQLYDIYTPGVSERLGFVTTAMHAYAHQWACQVVYAPRMRKGMGLTDGEGIERLWSRIRRLIPLTRNASARRRLWLLDRALSSISEDTMPGLADALNKKLKNVKKRLDAQKKPTVSRFSQDFVREQWLHQQSAQLSNKSQAPVRVKKELDLVLGLQAEIDSTQKSLESARKALDKDGTKSTALSILDELDKQQKSLATRVEDLYASVNVDDAFPGLKGPQLKFVRGLLMARDMKINIRKRAVGNFFEWDRLKQASGGRDEPLGTKLHQKARANIQKRVPALTNAIKRFNKKIDQLGSLYQVEWNLPLPEKLPTDLGRLKDDPNLLTDVWISTSAEEVPPWLSDPELREAIATMHANDRCAEEQARVGQETDNLRRWFRNEFLVVQVALLHETNSSTSFALMRYRNSLNVLTSRWRGKLIPGHLLKFWEETSEKEACRMLKMEPQPRTFTFIEPIVAESTHEPDDILTGAVGDEWGVTAQVDDVLMNDLLDDNLDFDFDDTPQALESEASLPSRDVPTLAPLSLRHGVQYHWHAPDIAHLRSPTARLNSECMNSGAALLKSILLAAPSTSSSSAMCCIFSTFDLPMIRDGSPSDALWRRTRNLEYWTKAIWIIPIHRAQPYEHWVLSVAQLKTGKNFLFDSLAEPDHWLDDIEVRHIVTFIHHLVVIGTHHGKLFRQPIPLDVPWDIRVLSKTAVQTTSYSCGLWVLASIGAVLSARHTTGLSELDMASLRSILLSRVRLLPTSSSPM
ncbi:hypothetical protein BKA70DRAFT_1101473 [Coprinopsis sp. MPI-PUGE-AT-0042]|nr:hypothetical protein BKA70DRAFT_1101473 [Coprinopsis sp. MPI-PUGE-AT-0042]